MVQRIRRRLASIALHTPVGGEDAQGAAAEGLHDAEVPFVESRDGVDVVPVGEHDQRCVGQAQAQIPVALDDLTGSKEVVDSEWRQFVRTGAQFGEQRQLGVDAGDLGGEVVQLGQHQRRYDQRSRLGEDLGARLVHPLVGDEGCQQHARVDDLCIGLPKLLPAAARIQ